jgi:hypothetical protein
MFRFRCRSRFDLARNVVASEFAREYWIDFMPLGNRLPTWQCHGTQFTASDDGMAVIIRLDRPCQSSAISIGRTVSGELNNSDCRSWVRGIYYYADRYTFSGTAGQQVAIQLTSSAFDTFLYLIGPEGRVLAQDNNGGGGTNSRIPPGSGYYTLPSSGTYTIEVTSYSPNATGSYTLSLSGPTIPAPAPAPSCTYSISPTSAFFGASGGSGSVSVTAPSGCSWTATSNASWITITSGSSGSGNGTVNYSVAANNSTSSRMGTMTIAGQTFTVNQAGASAAGCSVTPITVGQTVNGSLTTSDGRSPIKGSSYYCDRYTFSGTAGQQVAILLTSSAFDTYLYLIGPSGSVVAQDDDGGGGWNSRIPPGSGYYTLPSSGTYTIEVTSYSPNATGSYTLSLSGPTIPAPAPAPSCTYSISPTSAFFGASGGSGSVSVTAPSGCSWTATSNASWITITSGSSGSGNGTVNYSVAANNSTSSRMGTMTIAGQTFTVNQAGVGASPGPFSLTATPECSGGSPQVRLNWTASSGATSYDVYRNGSLYYSGLTGTQFLNTAVTAGTTYTYYVKARNAYGSTDSNTVTVTAPSCGASPGPFSLTATPECSGGSPQVRLNWTASSGATSYDVYRNGSLYYSGLTGTQFLNTAVTAGTTYTYYVKARNAYGSTDSNTVTVTAPSCGASPGPFSLTATPECSGGSPQVRLNWTASSGATSYDVYRNGSLYYSGLTGTQFLNTAVTAGTTYTYYVKARNAYGSTDSNTVTVTAPSCGASPGPFSLTATPECSGGSPQVRLNWTASSGATSYDVYRNGSLYYSGLTGTQFLNTAVTAGTTYTYYVKARNAYGSTDSNTVTVTAPSCGAAPGSRLPHRHP